jgi:hypothetical protein
MEGYCSTGQSPQWAVVPVEEEEEEEVYVDVCYDSHYPGIAKLLELLQPMTRNVLVNKRCTYRIKRVSETQQ